jgi:hypothetical protein
VVQQEVGGTCGRLGSHVAEYDTSSLPQPSEVNLGERPATSDDAEFRTEVLLASRHLSGSID